MKIFSTAAWSGRFQYSLGVSSCRTLTNMSAMFNSRCLIKSNQTCEITIWDHQGHTLIFTIKKWLFFPYYKILDGPPTSIIFFCLNILSAEDLRSESFYLFFELILLSPRSWTGVTTLSLCLWRSLVGNSSSHGRALTKWS